MKAVSNLSQSELNNLISEASRELEARKKSEAVVRDIHKVLEKHGISKRERSAFLDAAKSGGMASTRTPRRASKRKGARIAPKYRCPTSGDTWTGRGRAPAWVVNACDSNKLSIEAFKSDSTYLI